MRIEDTFNVSAPIDQVWRVLSDPLELASLFPGVEHVEKLTPVRTRARLRVKIGYVSATFTLEGEITEILSPCLVRSRVQGKDGKLGSTVIGETFLRLAEDGAGTRVDYAGDLQVTGHIASFGRVFIDKRARQDLGQFVRNVQQRFSESGIEAR